jgi:hypothetical protein
MQIQLTSHTRSPLDLDGNDTNLGDNIEPCMSRISVKLLLFFQHPSAGALAHRPMLPFSCREDLSFRGSARCVVAFTDPQHSHQRLSLGWCQRVRSQQYDLESASKSALQLARPERDPVPRSPQQGCRRKDHPLNSSCLFLHLRSHSDEALRHFHGSTPWIPPYCRHPSTFTEVVGEL